jgi:serine/threonine-protein kinase
MPLGPGTTLGPYSVTAKIGEGGMGEVYRARDTKLDRDVALKVLPQAFTEDPDRLARFEREAKVLASLNHPNIGGIHGLEESDGVRALVLEYIDGPTLADRIAQGPIPVDEALRIARQIAEALEAAHEAGVIHRDLKPANIKVREDGTVKVLDFGLAKALDTTPEGDPSLSPTLTAAATQMGVIMGTAAYMSPEQAKGKTVDRRGDVWAFGAVLYEMLTGQRAFAGSDVSEVLASVLAREPDWTLLPRDVSPVLGTFIRRCLQKDPKQRIGDVQDIRLAMEGAFETTVGPLAEPTAPQSARWQRVTPWVAAVVFACVTGLGVWNLRPSLMIPVSRFTVSAPGLEYGSLNYPLALSPDGRTVVYTATWNGIRQLYQRPMDQFEAVPIRGTEGQAAVAPFFSKDGASVGFYAVSEQVLKKIPLAGGTPTTLTPIPAPDFRLASGGPDGTIVFARRENGLWSVADTGGEPRRISPMEGEEGPSYYDPWFFRDGSAVLFTIVSGSGERHVAVRSLETGEQNVLLEGTSARLTATGHLLFTRADSLWAVPFDVGRLDVAGEPSPVLEGIQTTQDGIGRFALGGNGSLVYVSGDAAIPLQASTLVWVDRNGQETELAAPAAPYRSPRISVDGMRVAVTRVDQQSDVWIWELSGETLTRLTLDAGDDSRGEWTPDGQRVVFTSNRESSLALFWRAADFTGSAGPLTEADEFRYPQAVAPDGSVVVFRQAPTGTSNDLKMLSLTGDPVIEDLLSTAFDERSAAISPNGRWFAYQSDISGGYEIYVRSFPDAEAAPVRTISTSGGIHPVWGPNGTELFYVNNSRLWSVEITMEPTFSRGTPTLIIDDGYPLGASRRQYDVDPLTGDRFLMIKPLGVGDGAATASIKVVENWVEELKSLVPDQ